MRKSRVWQAGGEENRWCPEGEAVLFAAIKWIKQDDPDSVPGFKMAKGACLYWRNPDFCWLQRNVH